MTTADDDYVLGTDAAEIARLRTQHEAWLPQLRAFLDGADGLEGKTVLDLGCGPGFTTVELARRVGPNGKVIACDESRRFLDHLDHEARRLGITCVELRLGHLEQLALPDASVDAAYGRWVLSWIDDADGVVRSVARALRPGGAILLQEYVNWGNLRVLPRDPSIDRAIEACRASWASSEGEIDVAEHLPRIAERHGLELRSFDLVARTGRPRDEVWQWVGEFFAVYLPRLVGRALLTERELDGWAESWARMTATPGAVVIAPIVANVVLVRH